MIALADGDWVAADGAPPNARREASGLVAALLQWHLERGLRSLTLVDRGAVRPYVAAVTPAAAEPTAGPRDGPPAAPADDKTGGDDRPAALFGDDRPARDAVAP